MSKKKVSARSSAASAAIFGSPSSSFGFGSSGFSPTSASSLSYVSQPPDLSALSDPSTVVLFKNLSKNNETTKAKALEDLQTSLEKSREVEEAIIIAWIQLYPRLATDISRRVRQLAHAVHGVICQKSGKRIAKHMPKVVGPWLAGSYDNDRGASRAAKDALKLVFSSEEKIKSVWKAYDAGILEFCKDTILNESVNSLSDERSVSPDDAEAKFSRVIATCVLTVVHLMAELPADDLKKRDDLYQELFSSSKLWQFAQNGDPYLRKAIYKLLQVSLRKRNDLISSNLESVASSIITKALTTSQIGSVLDFLDALLELTLALPTSWTVAKLSKKRAPASSINRFIKLGSQSSSPDYWEKVSKLIVALPKETLTGSLSSVQELLNAVVDSIQLGQEPRSHLVSAWNAYFSICYHFLTFELEDEVKNYILGEALYSIYQEYIKSNNEKPRYKLPYYGAVICSNGLLNVGSRGEKEANLVIPEILNNLEKMVLEEISREADGEENKEGLGERWVELSAEILRKSSPDNPVLVSVKDSNVSIILRSIELLIAHKGKNIPSAVILEQILLQFGGVVLENIDAQMTVTDLLVEKSTELLESPSLPYILGSLIAYGAYSKDYTSFQEAWKSIICALLDSPLKQEKIQANILKLLKSTPSDLRGKIPKIPQLEQYVLDKLKKALGENEEIGWEIVNSAVISQETAASILAELTKNLALSDDERTVIICKQLGIVARKDPSILAHFVAQEGGADLLSRLLVLSESLEENVSAIASSLSKEIEQAISKQSANKENANQVLFSLIDILSKSVYEPTEEHLSLDYLASKAKELVNRAPENARAALSEKLYFSEEQWSDALEPFLRGIRNVSLAITNSLGSCVFLVENESSDISSAKIARDEMGFSGALRMAMFTINFLREMGSLNRRKDAHPVDIFENMSVESRTRLFYHVALVLEIAKDNLAIAGTNDLWNEYSPDIEAEIMKFVSDAQQFVADCLYEQEYISAYQGNTNETALYLLKTWDRVTEDSKGKSLKAFYAARVMAFIVADLAENVPHAAERHQAWKQDVNVRKTQEIIQTAGMLSGMADLFERRKLKDGEKFRNELISDLTGIPAAKAGGEGLRKMILLNVLLSNSDEITHIPVQRVVFLMKNLATWFQEDASDIEITPALITESAKMFTSLVPLIKDVYGEYWQFLCDFVLNCWLGCTLMEEDQMPMVYSTLKLYHALTSMESPNDDLAEVLSSSTDDFYAALLGLLQNSRKSDEQHQPRNLCNTLICRHTRDIALKHIKEPEKVDSQPIQEAAYQLLHRYIPSLQEQISIDAAISKDEDFEIQLPPELLSIIMDAPSIADIEAMSFVRSIPSRLRDYLLSWVLVFDHFQGSSFKVKSAYVESLKKGGYLSSFLELAFEYLGHSKGKPVDASKFKIESYKLGEEDDPQKDAQRLFVHLYYLALRHSPSLAKSWWMECKARQKVISVEAFTEKYLSPLLIDNELDSVQTWVQSQASSSGAADDPEMQVKVSRTVREVTAIYPVDDQTMEIVVRLPLTFPLKLVEVEGIKRVGLNQKQFRKMQMASQAVINFQSGSIIDGLTLFRKNVSLHLQGIDECAICYSILAVTPDRSLPNKACATCKNKFHSTCLLKWFKTSNSSSCPLCRTSFSFYS
ncbi:hypothetical protein RUND412_000456 [Rhizina undulata]